MPRNDSGVYQKAEPSVQTLTTIASEVFNNTIDDLVTDANAARPLSAGGTGATSAVLARTSLSVAEKQSAVGDAAAGKGLIVGAFGLGGTAFTETDFDDLDPRTYVVRTAATSTTNAPSTADEWAGLVVMKDTTNGFVLLAGVDNDYLKLRNYEDSTWGSWMDVPVVVSVTTGANGQATRYSDGRQVCIHAIAAGTTATLASGNIFITSANLTWTFPEAFSSTSRLFVSGSSVSSPTSWVTFDALTTTAAEFRRACSVTAAGTITINLRAEGTWR